MDIAIVYKYTLQLHHAPLRHPCRPNTCSCLYIGNQLLLRVSVCMRLYSYMFEAQPASMHMNMLMLGHTGKQIATHDQRLNLETFQSESL